MSRTGDIVLSRYRIVEPASEMTLWVSYRAQDLQAEREGRPAEPDTLIKIVRPELAHDEPSRAYLLRELLKVRLLHHPAVLRPSEVQIAEETKEVVLAEPMQTGLSQGAPLHRLLSFRKEEADRFTLEEVRRIGVQLASALGYIHGQLLCHGDLRLESVLLRPDGAKLCDVGLGRALPRGPYLEAIGKGGELHLLAPEVRLGRPPDARSDIFSLAALYRHLLSLGDDAAWEAFQRDHGALALVFQRALLEDPQLRYQSVEAFVADVESVALTGAPVRRRHSPTPLAMAVAAGRLPVEELDRPMEEIKASGHSGEIESAAVLAPLSTSPSARVSIGTLPPRVQRAEARPEAVPAAPAPPAPLPEGSAPAPEAGADGGERAAAPDIDLMPTRPVQKADLSELELSNPRPQPPQPSPPPSRESQRGADQPAGEDIGAQHTVPHAKLDVAAQLVTSLDTTLEQLRLDAAELGRRDPDPTDRIVAPPPSAPDPDDLPTTAVPRVDPADRPADRPVDRPADRSAPAPAIVFQELPPLMPPGMAQEESKTGTYTPPPRPVQPAPSTQSARPRIPTPAAVPADAGNRPRPAPAGAPARPPITRLTVAGALLLSAVVGALATVLAFSIYHAGRVPAPAPQAGPPAPPAGKPPPPVEPPAAPAPAIKAAAPPPAVAPAEAAAGSPCPAGMVQVAATTPFCIDQHEQPGAGQRPRVGLSAREAEAACQKLGRRLCSDAEWEAACRGKGRASYPYGHDPRPAICNVRGGALDKAGARAGCVSAAGAFDMAGNAAEWVRGGGLRGGSAGGETDGRCSVRLKVPPAGKGPFTGFRCCL